MSQPSWNEEEARRLQLSALIDGEADATGAASTCAAWRENIELRATWHAYHLIGDVLRSDDLAHPVQRDEAFLASLRVRLADQPVVLAPSRRAAGRRRAWIAPATAAAGFMAVAGVLVVTRMAAPGGDSAVGSTLAAAPGRTVSVSTTAPSEGDVQAIVADGKLIRDARLERYLAAHKQYGGSSAVTVPGVVLRSATTIAPER